MNTKPTIKEIEDAMSRDSEIQIMPDGSVIAVDRGTAVNSEPKIITAKYAAAEYY